LLHHWTTKGLPYAGVGWADLAVLLDLEPSVEKWERLRSDESHGVDFVVETKDGILILDILAPSKLTDPAVNARAAAATAWCKTANGAGSRKRWTYARVNADRVMGAVTLDDLIKSA
jgi:type III restriction enzyme